MHLIKNANVMKHLIFFFNLIYSKLALLFYSLIYKNWKGWVKNDYKHIVNISPLFYKFKTNEIKAWKFISS